MKNIDTIKRDFLIENSDDYAGLWSLIHRIKFGLGYTDPATVRGITISLLTELLRQGLIKAGIPRISGEFEEWQLSPDEIVRRIEKEWDSLGREPNIGDIVWFTTTKAGDVKAQEFLN